MIVGHRLGKTPIRVPVSIEPREAKWPERTPPKGHPHTLSSSSGRNGNRIRDEVCRMWKPPFHVPVTLEPAVAMAVTAIESIGRPAACSPPASPSRGTRGECDD